MKKSYHLFMHTMALAFSGVMFKGASAMLDVAINHKTKLDTIRLRERLRSFGYHGGNVVDVQMPSVHYGDVAGTAHIMAGYEHLGPVTADEEEFIRNHEAMHAIYEKLSKNTWIEAEPCSDFDPIHPDYTPYPEK